MEENKASKKLEIATKKIEKKEKIRINMSYDKKKMQEKKKNDLINLEKQKNKNSNLKNDIDQWGMCFAEKCGAEKGTRKFDVLVNLVVNTFFCIVMTIFMTWFSLCVRGHAPIQAVPGGFMVMILPVWICCFFVSLFTQHPAILLAKKITGT